MLKRILGELGSSFIVCLGERVLERAVFPGLSPDGLAHDCV